MKGIVAIRIHPLAATFAVFIAVAACAALTSALIANKPPEWIRISGSQTTYTLADLEQASEAIAVVEFKSNDRTFWNSQDNAPWEPEIASGKLALIYRDDTFAVLDTLKGKLPDTLVVRGVGGQVGNVHMDYEGQVDWVKGAHYLLFLRRDDTPFEIGTERMWTVVWTGGGSFESSADGWVNAARLLQLSSSDVVQLRK
jgi:hypothetical protein